jgi:TldD protein
VSAAAGGTGAPLIGEELAGQVLERALAHGGDFAEVFCEERYGFSLSIDESRVERPQSGSERGAGIRVIDGETTRFAHVDGLAADDLLAAADDLSAALDGGAVEPRAVEETDTPPPQGVKTDPGSVAPERKADLLRELDERARAAGDEVTQVSANYAEGRRRVEVANSEGLFAGDDRTRVRLGAQVVARRGDAVETGFETLGALRGFELLTDDPGRIAEEAAGKALTLVGADPAPAGEMTVVVGGGFGGVLFHEMTGPGLESDAVQKGASAYLYDRLRARRDDTESTGNGRRESFRHLPIPRMTNTYIAPGDPTPEEIIADVDRGFYAVSFGGGQVEPATGDFVFGVSEGYLIENGKATRPCRGATLIGNCLQALTRIDAVGSDFEMKTGFCGKAGQRAPVGTGQGHVRIRGMTVGGTAT